MRLIVLGIGQVAVLYVDLSQIKSGGQGLKYLSRIFEVKRRLLFMKLQTIKQNFNRGRMNIEGIQWLIQTVELLQAENGAMAEKHAEKMIAFAEFMQIIDQQKEEIALYKLTEAILLERLQKQTMLMKEMQKNSRLLTFYAMAEENLKFAEENARLKELVKA
jgi:hypothetical protein